MKVLISQATIMSISEIKSEIEKIKKIQNNLGDIQSFGYKESLNIHKQLQTERERLENIVEGVKDINIERGEYRLQLNRGFSTYTVVDGSREIHDLGYYDSKSELLEALNNICKTELNSYK